MDIKSKRLYHEDEYEIATVDGVETFAVCEMDEKSDDSEIIWFNDIQHCLSFVLNTISLIGLFLHILIHSSLKRLRQSQPAKNLLSLVCSLFIGQMLFFFGFNFHYSQTICVFVAVSSHYFLLVSFFCMNVISYDMCRTFISTIPSSHRRNRVSHGIIQNLPNVKVDQVKDPLLR